MSMQEHVPTLRGLALGVLLLVALLTHGFGLLGSGGNSGEQQSSMVRRGNQIIVPEGSMLRQRLTVLQAPAKPVSAKLVLPAIVESDPARTALVLPPLGGRVLELKVALGERVVHGQSLAVIDSPDLAQAYDDNDKA